MKSISLLALRITTGALLIIWGSLRAFRGSGVGLADRYYGGGALSDATLQTAFGWGQIAIGALVILGLLRIVSYPLQAVILVGGALAIWKHIFDPLGLYLQDSSNLLFFPSSTVAVAAVILLIFREYDTIALDKVFRRS